MISKLPSLAIAAYLFLCVILGGSAQGTWGNLALQLAGIALITCAAVFSRAEAAPRAVSLYWILLAGLVVIALQLVPMPPSLWAGLPGRRQLSQGFDLLGLPSPALPVSEDPYASVATLFVVIPAIAAFCAIERLRPSPRLLAFAVVAATALAVLLGAMQVAEGPGSWAYFYKVTNAGAVGFFANRDHMATLLLISIPLTSALIFGGKGERLSPVIGRYAAGGSLLVVVLVGIALNGSLAAFGLVVPVVVASAVIGQVSIRWRRFAVPVAILALAAGIVVMVTAPVPGPEQKADVTGTLSSRVYIWKTTTESIRDTFPLGTGLGTFASVYPHYEDPLAVTNRYVNHAHNDYLEVVSDLGFAGVLLICAFLLWWAVTSVRIWQSRLSTPLDKAATIVTFTVLIHSLVDFPLRTAAISAIFAAALALMAIDNAGGWGQRRGGARHVKLG